MSTEDYDDFKVFGRLAEGRLSAEEFEQVQERLMTDAEFRRRYVRFMDMDFELSQRLGREVPVPDSASAQVVPLPAPNLAPVTEAVPTPRVPSASSRRPAVSVPSGNGFGRALLKLAAILVLGVGAWWATTTYNFEFGNLKFTSAPTTEATADPPIEEPVVEPSPNPETKEPVIVRNIDPEPTTTDPEPSQLPTETAAHPVKPAPMAAETTPDDTGEKPDPEVDASTVLGQVWSADKTADEWPRGKEMTAGEYTLARGTIEIRLFSGHENEAAFESAAEMERFYPAGARLIVEAPARFALRSADHVQLLSGKLSADVFPVAKGFTVTASGVDVVDLGTRFAVTANENGDMAIHVYDGMVTGKVAEAVDEPTAVRSGETVRLDLDSGRLRSIAFQSSLFAPKPPWTGGITEVSEKVRILNEAPEDSEEDSLKTGEYIVFKERSGEVLRHRLAVDIRGSHGESGEQGKTFIPRDTKVTSYLVQRFPPDAIGEAFLRFDSPILGIIFTEENLFETDRRLGAPQTKYQSPGNRTDSNRGGREAEDGEILGISEDGCSVRLRFNAGGKSSDSARIIVVED